MRQWLRKIRRAILNQDPSFCDMHEDVAARGAADEYLGHIRKCLRERFDGRKHLRILDAGCQAGRLLIPLAEDGHQLIGVDASGFSLRRAAQHVKERGLSVCLHRGNIAQLRQWVSPASLDVVICTEVLYLCRDYESILSLLAQSLKPGGMLCISHRPTAYYATVALEHGADAQAADIARRSDGPSTDGDYHNWQTEPQLRALYERAGCSVLACAPINRQERTINFSDVMDDIVRRLLRPFHENKTVRVPSYLLIIAQRVSWAAA